MRISGKWDRRKGSQQSAVGLAKIRLWVRSYRFWGMEKQRSWKEVKKMRR
jgi:hypothetical protein